MKFMDLIKLFTTYGFFGLMRVFIQKIKTGIFFKNARLIRTPIIIRGKRNIDFGLRLTTGVGCRIEAYPTNNLSGKIIQFGTDVEINDYVHITAMKSVKIGNHVLMASKIYISDCSHGFYEGGDNDSNPNQPPKEREYRVAEVQIHDNVWLGEFVSVLPGVTIGEGSIIGSNSVVTKDIPANSIAVGCPARVIKKFNFKTKKWERIK